MPVTFIHTADLHLDRPFKGLTGCPEPMLKRIRESTFTALDRLVQTACIREVDFVVFAGDIFDTSKRGLRAQTRFRSALRKLEEKDIDAYIIHGNHDPLDGEWHDIAYGKNVHTFGPTPEMLRFDKPGHPCVHLYGFSYATRHIHENMLNNYQWVPGADFNIGILHGSLQGNTSHDVYAPFAVQDLLKKDFDYWALGHIHKREALHNEPPIYYAGSNQGLSFKETGDKGFNLVTLDHNHTTIDFIPVADILWDDLSIDVSDLKTLDELLQKTERVKEEVRSEKAGHLVRLTLTGDSPLHHALADETVLDDYIETLQDLETERENFVWIVEMMNNTNLLYDREALLKESHFLGDLARLAARQQSVMTETAQLFRHTKAKKYLDPLNPKDEQSMIEAAERLLLEALHGNSK